METIAYNCCTQLKGGTIVRLQTFTEKDKDEICLLSVSVKGRIGVFDLTLNMRTSFMLHCSPKAECKTTLIKRVPEKKQTQGWITDAIYMEDCNILVLASCGRSLHFFTSAVVPFSERFRIHGMKDIPTCLAYMPPKICSSEPGPCLVIGDDGGDVFVLNFLKHSQALFKKTEIDVVEQIYWKELHLQAGMVKLSVLPGCHNSPVLQVDIKGALQRVVSCSRNPKNSLAIRHVRGKMIPIFYNCRHGITCFDFDEKNGLVVTGSTDAKLRLWSPTEKAKAWLTLSGHTITIVSVWLHNNGKHLWSMCEKPELFNWDLNQVTCIRKIELNFTIDIDIKKNSRIDLGRDPLLYIKQKGILYVSCRDQIAAINLGGEEAENSRKIKRRSLTPVGDCMSNVEQKIPTHFRQALLDFGNYEEDEYFYNFVEELKSAFEESTNACQHLKEFEETESITCTVYRTEDEDQKILISPQKQERNPPKKSALVYDWEERETAIVMAPNNLIPMNEIKLRELGRLAEIEKHVKAGTPFCGLQLLEPLEVQLPVGLPVTTRMKKRGIQSIDHLDQVRAMTNDMFTDGLLSSLSSARSSLASSVMSYYRHKRISDKSPTERSGRSNLHVTPSGSKTSLDIITPRSNHSEIIDEIVPDIS